MAMLNNQRVDIYAVWHGFYHGFYGFFLVPGSKTVMTFEYFWHILKRNGHLISIISGITSCSAASHRRKTWGGLASKRASKVTIPKTLGIGLGASAVPWQILDMPWISMTPWSSFGSEENLYWKKKVSFWLVVWNMNGLFSISYMDIYWMSSFPTDFHIFQDGYCTTIQISDCLSWRARCVAGEALLAHRWKNRWERFEDAKTGMSTKTRDPHPGAEIA